METSQPSPLTRRQRSLKRAFDVAVAGVGLILASPLILVGWVVAAVDTRAHGMFRQERVGMDGSTFEMLKLRTMKTDSALTSTVTVSQDIRITRSGALLRKLKIDELPQLINVLRGEMSIVGPRPDVPGFADQLSGADRVVLSVRPGITSPAALAYRHEEELLATVPDPESFNRQVIWPDKVRLNRDYVENYAFTADLRCLASTIAAIFDRSNDDEARP